MSSSGSASLSDSSGSQSDYHVRFDPFCTPSPRHKHLHSPPPSFGRSTHNFLRKIDPLSLLRRKCKPKDHASACTANCYTDDELAATSGATADTTVAVLEEQQAQTVREAQETEATTREIRRMDDVRRMPLDWLPLPAIRAHSYTLLPLEMARECKNITHRVLYDAVDTTTGRVPEV